MYTKYHGLLETKHAQYLYKMFCQGSKNQEKKTTPTKIVSSHDIPLVVLFGNKT